ncbi:hypothetical protein, partial [Streptococcus suis]|uniref:hypothetical protein n=3 Tax=Streptococcus suis TaxID=1307 RepID=UPI0037564424
KALSATSIAGGFLVFLYEKNWLEAITKAKFTKNLAFFLFTFSESLLIEDSFLLQSLFFLIVNHDHAYPVYFNPRDRRA